MIKPQNSGRKPTPWLLILALIAPLGMLTSCLHNSLSHQALSFNRTVQDHRVEQLLLNVLRASNREPMALTAVTSLSTSNNRSMNIGPVSGGFGQASIDLYNGVLSGNTSASPNMAITILDDDPEFMKGFVEPVPETSIRYFLEQGWNAELLSYLLIEEIRYSKLGDLTNDPRDPEEFDKFVSVLEQNLQNLQLVEEQRAKRPQTITTTSTTTETGQQTQVVTEDAANVVVKRGGLHIEGSEASIIMRSPQGVIYYLGELARIQLNGKASGTIPVINSSNGDQEPLFLIEKAHGSKSGVSYRGQFYKIPHNKDSRSLQALAFVQQLINLQAKKLAPPPSTLRLLTP